MSNQKKYLLLLLFHLLMVSVIAQDIIPDTNTILKTSSQKNRKITGQPIVDLFFNFHTSIIKPYNNIGFEMERSYLGYQFNLTPSLSGKVILDVGNPKISDSELERIAYLKNACLNWHYKKWTLDVGLITLTQFSLQEKFWGYRYIYKSFQDANKFGSSADLGIVLKYQLTHWLAADLSLTNGEGYKKMNIDNRFRYSIGMTVTPVKSLVLRVYYDRKDKLETDTSGKTQETVALFIGYKNKICSIGGEYNMFFNAKNSPAKHMMGASVYSTFFLPKHFKLFLRCDYLSCNSVWQDDREGITGIFGFEYTPVKWVSISPNLRCQYNKKNELSILGYLNLLVKL